MSLDSGACGASHVCADSAEIGVGPWSTESESTEL